MFAAMDAATLPDLDQLDSKALKSLILALHEQVFSHRKQLTTQQEEILSQRKQLASRDAEIEHLKLLIAKLRRMEFGRSSEKRENQIEQLELRLEELEVRRRKETTTTPGSTGSATVARPARRPLPDHLPREVRKCLPKHAACPDCGGKLKHLGEDISRSWNTCRPVSKSSNTFVPSWLVPVAIVSCSRKPRAGQSSEAWRVLGFWPMCWYRNTVTTCRCIVSRRSMRGPEWSWIVPPWRSG